MRQPWNGWIWGCYSMSGLRGSSVGCYDAFFVIENINYTHNLSSHSNNLWLLSWCDVFGRKHYMQIDKESDLRLCARNEVLVSFDRSINFLKFYWSFCGAQLCHKLIIWYIGYMFSYHLAHSSTIPQRKSILS